MEKSPSKPNVTLVLAVRNEADHIRGCLESLLSQDYPAELTEINVVDGMSDDGTSEIIEEFRKKDNRIRVFKNPQKTSPAAFNLGIKNAGGDLIFIMGGHNSYPKEYVKKCSAEMIKNPEVDNVGGVIKTRPLKQDLISRAIVFTLTSPFGVGGAKFRRKIKKPAYAATVFGGCYRKKVFDEIGTFNEELVRTQDMELNLRLAKAGGKILLVPDIWSYYYPRTNIWSFIKYNYNAGKWPIYAVKLTKTPLRLMHYVPGLFVLGLATGWIFYFIQCLKPLFYVYLFFVLLYLLFSLIESARAVIKGKNILFLFITPFVFAARHLSYGAGSIVGLLSRPPQKP